MRKTLTAGGGNQGFYRMTGQTLAKMRAIPYIPCYLPHPAAISDGDHY